MNFNSINKITQAILSSIGINNLPIDVESIAQTRGLNIISYPLESKISGILVISQGNATIGYNKTESRQRQRFTIAHELGHFELHKDLTQIFYDKSFKIMYRSGDKVQGESARIEREANAFAAAILMPEEILKNEIKKIEFDLGSEESITSLAQKFDVSTTAMHYRILNLGLMEI